MVSKERRIQAVQRQPLAYMIGVAIRYGFLLSIVALVAYGVFRLAT